MVIPIIMSCSKLIFLLNSFTFTIGRGGETRLRRCIRLFLIFGQLIDTLHHKNNSSLPKLQLLFALVAGMRLFWIIFFLDTILQRPTTKFLLPLFDKEQKAASYWFTIDEYLVDNEPITEEEVIIFVSWLDSPSHQTSQTNSDASTVAGFTDSSLFIHKE